MRIVSSAKIKKALREDLEESFQHAEFRFFGDIDEARSSLPEADVLITYGEDLTAREIKEAKNLKWIMVISAGMDSCLLKRFRIKVLWLQMPGGYIKSLWQNTRWL